MLNESELTPEQIRIIQLELEIEKFKKYDAERKAYYAKMLIEHGEMQSYIHELENDLTDEKLLKKVKAQRETIIGLQRIIKINKYQDTFEDLSKKTLQLKVKELEDLIKELKSKNKSLTKHIHELVDENFQLLNKIKKLTEEQYTDTPQ